MKKYLSVFIIITICLSITGCTEKSYEQNNSVPKKEKYTASFLDLFDTASTIIAYDTSQKDFDRHYEQFYNELEKYDHLYDIYNAYEGITNLYTVNKLAGQKPVKVSKEIIDLLNFSKYAYEITNGKTNICFGTVLELWHNEREIAKNDPSQAKVPDEQALINANKHTDIDDLIIDEENSTVYFNDSDMKLDVGAVAKGYAVSRVAKWANDELWTSAAISIGGNVATFGYKNDDSSTLWKIGIENPDTSKDDYLLKVDITDSSVVTSGDYQRYFIVDGIKYCHIINPDTLVSSNYMASVSVISDSSALGDALSTALFNMPIDQGVELINSMDGVEAVWVDKEYNKTFSSGFEGYIGD